MEKKKNDFIVTEEMVRNARRYMPLAKKIAYAKIYAPECIEEVEISVQKTQSDSTMAMPQMYIENALKKKLILFQIFLDDYLRINIESEFTAEEYDKYAEFHPMNQLERMKTNPSIKDKVFDMLADYKELKQLLDVEIFNIKQAHNDALERFLAGIAVTSDPQTLQKLMAELKKASNEFTEKQKTAHEDGENELS